MDANGTRFHLLLGRGDWSRLLWFDAAENAHPLEDAWLTSPLDSPSSFDSPASFQDNESGLAWDSCRAELTLQPRLFRFAAAPKDDLPKLEQRRGAARDRFGNWYWIDESERTILVNSSGSGVTTPFWPDPERIECPPALRLGDFQPLQPPPAPLPLRYRGLAVTTDHYLVVGIMESSAADSSAVNVSRRAGILIFDLHAGGPPRQLWWPAPIAFSPFDMAAMPGGGVWILDRIHQRYWALDHQFNVIRASQYASPPVAAEGDFQPAAGGSNPLCAPARLALFDEGDAMPLNMRDPIAIESLPDCTVLLLDYEPDEPFARIHRYRFDQRLGQPVSTASMAELIEESQRTGFRLIAHDFAFVPEHDASSDETACAASGHASGNELVPDRLYLVAGDGNQAFAFTLHQDREDEQFRLQPIAEYLPMRRFGGKALVAAEGDAYYDFGDGWIPLIAQSRPRYVESATFATPIAEDAPVLDGREPNCVWHRLLLDACIPHEAEVLVWSRAANSKSELATATWHAEPRFYRRGDGSEQPFIESEREGRHTWELLFQRAAGRFLQLRVTLRGNGRVSPRLHALRVYYPRFSYLEHYLPSLYRDEAESASFLDRFLANIEGFYTALEDKIAAVQILFDARSAPPETLEWLASWYCIALDPTWDETRRRLLIRHAMTFFQWRGTRRGLLMALRLTLDECPDESIFLDAPPRLQRGGTVRIIEKYRTRILPNVVLGDNTELSGLRAVETGSATGRWQPSQGGDALRRRYAEFLSDKANAPVDFPLAPPADPAAAQRWTDFARRTLGFLPAAGEDDLPHWQAFLSRRYRRIDALNLAYGLSASASYQDFGDVPLPGDLPPDGAPLLDWYQFEGIVLAMRRVAHQFSVLLPTPIGARRREADANRLAWAKRLIELEKPSHTTFDVRFYWAMFRVGAARIGEDTLLDRGSRAPELMPPLVLGQNYLAEAYLTAGHPQNVTGRQVVGNVLLSE